MQRRDGKRGFGLADEESLAARAALYVSGKMDPAERESAERDLLEIAAFREAVLKAAQRSGRLPDPEDLQDGRDWRQIAAGLARLPQMGRGPAEKQTPAGTRPDDNRDRTRMPSGRSLLVAALAFLCGMAVMVAGGNRLFETPPRTLSVAVLVDQAGIAAATVESRSDGSLRVLMAATPGLPLTLLRLSDAGTAEERIGEVPLQGELVFAGAGLGAAPADYRLAPMKDDGSAAATVAAGTARGIVRD